MIINDISFIAKYVLRMRTLSGMDGWEFSVMVVRLVQRGR